MTGFLVDTNVPSELTRVGSEPQVEAFLREAGKARVYLSVLSLGEIVKGIASLPQSKRRIALEEWLESEMRPWFADRILPVSAAVAERWGLISAACKPRGTPLAVVDGLLAATALEHDLPKILLAPRQLGGFEPL